MFTRSKSDLTTTIREISALGEMLTIVHTVNCDVGILADSVTQQKEVERMETKSCSRGQKVDTTNNKLMA